MAKVGPDFWEMTKDIREHPLFLELKTVPHHGENNSLYDHLLDTAKLAYVLAHIFHMSPDRIRSVTRAAILHDFFGYHWRDGTQRRRLRYYSGIHKVTHMHAFIHGTLAARRANRVFGLNERQQAAITSHMFPLAPFPKNSEAWVLTLADKMVASREVGQTVGAYMAHWRHKQAG